jgi:hypothetical protein
MEGAVIDGLPQGLVSRPLTWDDARAVFRLEQASEAFDDGLAEIELSDVEEYVRKSDTYWVKGLVG